MFFVELCLCPFSEVEVAVVVEFARDKDDKDGGEDEEMMAIEGESTVAAVVIGVAVASAARAENFEAADDDEIWCS